MDATFQTIDCSVVYSIEDLKKVVFWMATGSGKTLLMHINYWQFMRYNQGVHRFDNIILITPNSGLSQQHLDELQASGIPAAIFQGDEGGYFNETDSASRRVKVIDIFKLKLPGKTHGEGVTVDISCFGTRNLVFVDEGHKGYASEDKKWKQIRRELTKQGFTFEYSATFGQAINSNTDDEFEEYSKAIIFDYSYKYFFKDGYGKDFRILNLDAERVGDDRTDVLLLANAVSFYEQCELYDRMEGEIADYMIEPPLWIFVGSKVQEKESDTLKSDMLRIVLFLSRLLSGNKAFPLEPIDRIIKGRTGLVDKRGNDVFAPEYSENNLRWLREKKYTAEQVLNGIYKRIFHMPRNMSAGKLHLVNISNADGEIGLKVGGCSNYFGVINIGDKSKFIDLLEKQESENIVVERDTTTSSLFTELNERGSTINILIGAKKFIEGWNSWRVSNMGLLNIGRSEGAQIIQLFGRGVRLKGLRFSLKRSRSLDRFTHPAYIEVLETLNVFGIRAAYMETFREAVEKEEIVYEEIRIDTKLMEPFPKNLKVLRLSKPPEAFKEEILFPFTPVEGLKARLNLLPSVGVIESRERTGIVSRSEYTTPATIKGTFVDLLDWDAIYHSILIYKTERGWSNVIVSKEILREIIDKKYYDLFTLPDRITPMTFEELSKVQDIVVLILQKYIGAQYNRRRGAWEAQNIELADLKADDEMLDRSYKVHVRESETELIEKVKAARDTNSVYRACGPQDPLKNVFISKHLYQPLLAMTKNQEMMYTVPTGLNEGEQRFIVDLRDYLQKDQAVLKGKNVTVLRNLTRGKGVGFFEINRFFPDFILWVTDDSNQWITFIDPKGLIFVDPEDQKLQLHCYLQDEVEPKIQNSSVHLNAFIVSDTSFEQLRARHSTQYRSREDCEKDHILFQQIREGVYDPTYVPKLIDTVVGTNRN